MDGDFVLFDFVVDDRSLELFALHSMFHHPEYTAMESFFLGHLFVILSVRYVTAAAPNADSTAGNNKDRAYSLNVSRHSIIWFAVDMNDKEDSIRNLDCICCFWVGCSTCHCSCERFVVLERFQNLRAFAEYLKIYDEIVMLRSSDGYYTTAEKAETSGNRLFLWLFLCHDCLFKPHVLWLNSDMAGDDTIPAVQ